jgi:hypothetical protein
MLGLIKVQNPLRSARTNKSTNHLEKVYLKGLCTFISPRDLAYLKGLCTFISPIAYLQGLCTFISPSIPQARSLGLIKVHNPLR